MANIKYILAFNIILLLSSCSDFLNLEPETSLSSAVAFDNIEGIEAGINGAYSIIHSDWVERQYIFAECLMSSVKQVNALSNSNYTQALTHENWSDLFNISGYFWQMSYRTIDVSNQIIQAIPNINADNDKTAADKARLEGEAYFLRGLMYFGLNRFFAQPQNGLSVPILTTPYQPDQFPFRASIEETKAQVIADLEQAESLMQNIESNDGRATIWSVRGMLARAYFEFKDYQKAQEYANLVIESGRFALKDGQVGSAYSTDISSENIFTFLSAANDRAANNLYERFSINNANVQLSLSADFWNQINQEPTDLRIDELHTDLGGGVACHKYDVRNMNIPFLRLPEMYLIRAESKAENNDLDGGLVDLNRLRQRVGLSATDYVNQSDLLEKIFHNRTVEMSMEGQNFHNLKRLEQPIGGYPWEEARFKLVFFIPLKEIQLNPNLIQNEIW